ncbi:MAG: LruC domain-containing protein [Spirochaetia bacterium]|nr:LruC domain-containing protein [Spirochaetia bacterium]
MKRIFLITILSIAQLTLISCGGGKKKAAWWMFLAGGSETAGSATTETTSSGGEATTTTNDQTGTTDFSFQTTTTIPVAVTVTDSQGPVEGAVVSVQNPATEPPETLFQAVTDESGNVSGTITVDTTVPTVNVVIDAGGDVVTQPVSTDHLIGIDRDVAYDGDVTIPTTGDTDGDGIPNDRDDYPDDPSRATKVAIGQSIIAYEDLYPSAGDADFNDYVIKVTNEEDLNAAGKIVRIRGSYTHVARGAGYTHMLRLKLPGVTGLSFHNKLYKADGTLESDATTTFANGNSMQILGTSSGTIAQSNTSSSQTFVSGKRADIEITLDTPATRAQVGAAPYDLYAYVNNTSKEIHFPRKYTNADGSDVYMDSHGFPWALQVPGTWEWPLESKNIENAYAGFRPWYLSNGETNKDWYLTANSSLVFNAPGLAGYIGKGYAGYTMLLVTALVGAAGLLAVVLIRRKQSANV